MEWEGECRDFNFLPCTFRIFVFKTSESAWDVTQEEYVNEKKKKAPEHYT